VPGTIPHSCAPHEPLSFSCAATSAAFIDAAASRAIANQRECSLVLLPSTLPSSGGTADANACHKPFRHLKLALTATAAAARTGNRTAPRSRRQRCAATRRRLERAPHALVRTAAPGGATRRDAKGSSSACASHAHALAWSLWSGAQAGRRAAERPGRVGRVRRQALSSNLNTNGQCNGHTLRNSNHF
jgi:hypothetical protein